MKEGDLLWLWVLGAQDWVVPFLDLVRMVDGRTTQRRGCIVNQEAERTNMNSGRTEIARDRLQSWKQNLVATFSTVAIYHNHEELLEIVAAGSPCCPRLVSVI